MTTTTVTTPGVAGYVDPRNGVAYCVADKPGFFVAPRLDVIDTVSIYSQSHRCVVCGKRVGKTTRGVR